MKKVVLAAAIAVSSLTFAQQFGIKVGMNVSSISKDGYDDTTSKIGYNAGLFVNIPLGTEFSVQPEVLYNDLGSKVTLSEVNAGGTTYRNTYARNLDYISVPVMFQYNVVPEFYLEAGPQFSFLVDANDKYKSTENGSTTGTNTHTLNKDNFNNFDFGAAIGAGFNVTPQFGINARYVAGFSDINKNGNTSINNDNNKNRNNNFQVGLTYKFGK